MLHFFIISCYFGLNYCATFYSRILLFFLVAMSEREREREREGEKESMIDYVKFVIRN